MQPRLRIAEAGSFHTVRTLCVNRAVLCMVPHHLVWTEKDIEPTPRSLLECKTPGLRGLQFIVKSGPM